MTMLDMLDMLDTTEPIEPGEPTTDPVPTDPDVDPGGDPYVDPQPIDPDIDPGGYPEVDPDYDPAIDPYEEGTDPYAIPGEQFVTPAASVIDFVIWASEVNPAGPATDPAVDPEVNPSPDEDTPNIPEPRPNWPV